MPAFRANRTGPTEPIGVLDRYQRSYLSGAIRILLDAECLSKGLGLDVRARSDSRGLAARPGPGPWRRRAEPQ